MPIDDSMLYESLMAIDVMLCWFIDIVNYKETGLIPTCLDHRRKNKLIYDGESYFWDEPILYKLCSDSCHWLCVPDEEMQTILTTFPFVTIQWSCW